MFLSTTALTRQILADQKLLEPLAIFLKSSEQETARWIGICLHREADSLRRKLHSLPTITEKIDNPEYAEAAQMLTHSRQCMEKSLQEITELAAKWAEAHPQKSTMSFEKAKSILKQHK